MSTVSVKNSISAAARNPDRWRGRKAGNCGLDNGITWQPREKNNVSAIVCNCCWCLSNQIVLITSVILVEIYWKTTFYSCITLQSDYKTSKGIFRFEIWQLLNSFVWLSLVHSWRISDGLCDDSRIIVRFVNCGLRGVAVMKNVFIVIIVYH